MLKNFCLLVVILFSSSSLTKAILPVAPEESRSAGVARGLPSGGNESDDDEEEYVFLPLRPIEQSAGQGDMAAEGRLTGNRRHRDDEGGAGAAAAAADSNDSDDGDEYVPEPLSPHGGGAAEDRLSKIARIVKGGAHSYAELAGAMKIKESSARQYAHLAKKNRLLSKEETASFDTREEKKYWRDVIALIQNQRPLEEIYEKCAAKDATWPTIPDEQERKNRLNRIFGVLYKKRLLTSQQTAYLKCEGTVVGRRGETKGHIRAFLTERYTGALTATLSALNDEFTAWALSHHLMSRGIQSSSFGEHIKQMTDLDPAILRFVENCKMSRDDALQLGSTHRWGGR